MSTTLQISPRAREWLRCTESVRVLHRFDDVCNLVNQDGEVLSLQTAVLPLGPFSWQVQTAVWQSVDINSREWVQDGRFLHIGGWRLDAETAVLWQPVPEWARLRGYRTPQVAAAPDLAMLHPYFEALQSALRRQDLPATREATYHLAGRGPGLTPAGDDYLVGVLHALWVCSWSAAWMAAMVETAVVRTTTLSAAFLHAAAAGEAIEPWHRLCQGEKGAVADIVAVGESSGTAVWLGFVQTLGIVPHAID